MAATISERLHAALQKINRPARFCASGGDRAANPGLVVDGIGPIGLPLTSGQTAELKSHCQTAAYGKGVQTLVDPNVRRVLRLAPERFSLTNPDWATFLRSTVATVQDELGLEERELKAHLYELLMYEPGGFFLPHRDGEKLDGMVATLVVVLPGQFSGGELVVRHDGQERTIDFAADGFNPFHTHFAAFYADCEHEIRPLKSGHRLCLVYNLTLAKGKSKTPVVAPRLSGQVDELAELLRKWPADDPSCKLAVPLAHQYTRDGLAWDALKGADRAKADALRDAGRRANCRVYLALLTYWQSGGAEYADYEDDEDDLEMGELLDSSLTAEQWRSADGAEPDFGQMALEPEEVVPPAALTAVEPEEASEGYTGNEGMTIDRWYRHAALVLWPESRHFEVLCDSGSATAFKALAGRVAEAGDPGAARRECVPYAIQILDHCDARECDDTAADQLLRTLLALGEPALIRNFLSKIVAGNERIVAGSVIRAACVQHGWATFRSELEAIFGSKSDGMLRWENSRSAILTRNLALLEELCSTGAPDAARGELCTRLARLAVEELEGFDRLAAAGPEWRFRGIDRAAILGRVARSLIAIGLFNPLGKFVDRTLGDTKLYPLADHVAALIDLQPWLAAHLDQPCDGVTRWVAECRSQLEALTAEEPSPPRDQRREADIPCKCADCAELKRFLIDPNERSHRFRAAEARRKHWEAAISSHRLDLSCETERKGSPRTLVCTKTQASFEARLKEYHEQSRQLETLREIEERLPA